MRLPTRVILCFASLLIFLASFRAFSTEISFRAPKHECVLAPSTHVDRAVASAALAQLNGRFHNSCNLLPDLVDGPFSDASMSIWKNQSGTSFLGFWLDIPPGGKEMILRGIDLKSLLQFGQARASIVGLSDFAGGSVAKSLVEQVIGQYPFTGYIENNGFFTWAKGPVVKVIAVKREETQRHPFLPYLFDIPTLPIKNSFMVLDKSEGAWKLEVASNFHPSLGERLWLKIP
ncbi:MAG: hypothetical protein JWQ35_1802 [Bacteriovoracaceae bacterium]|nr:hypothetical protein [Bacteriovoracaceae bacterium]